MPTLTVDGVEVTVAPGSTVLQACEAIGVEIPRFCYHDRLSVAGNCRMCLVHIEKAPKPVASCAMPAGDGMVIHTETSQVKKSREGVMEFLLLNHPLDCPICDQAGECDLQDQAMGYGKGGSRTREKRRAVKEKYMGPLVSTVMTRCIHCTRCIRFIDEVAGTPVLGGLNRGENLEVTSYVESAIRSELSGNLVDLCPVGALTSTPYKFKSRPWELTKTESIDVMDAVGSHIRFDSRGKKVLRILPRLHEDINEEWISDKTRYIVDGLSNRRLDVPYIRQESGALKAASWAEAFARIKQGLEGLHGNEIAALAGDLACAESMHSMRDLMEKLGSRNVECRIDGSKVDPAIRSSYLFNTTIAGIEEADALLIVGSNPKWEATVLNARIRKRYLKGGFKVALIGQKTDLTFKYQHLGEGVDILQQIANNEHEFAEVLQKASRPMIIFGSGAVARQDGASVLALGHKIATETGMIIYDQEGSDGTTLVWNGFNVLQNAASRVAGLDLGFVPEEGGLDAQGIINKCHSGAIKAVFLLGVDTHMERAPFKNPFTVYLGTHGDIGIKNADVVLPAATYVEKNALYVNTEGRVQETSRVHYPVGDAREDWTIIRALSEVLGHTLPYDNLFQLRECILERAPWFAHIDVITRPKWEPFGSLGDISNASFEHLIEDFYLTNPIARASEVMLECSRVFVHNEPKEPVRNYG